MWGWHIPALYDAALRNSYIHVFEHLCFAAAGTLYWWHIMSPIRSRMRLGGLGPVAYMTSTKLLVGLLGIALAFAPASFYPFYEHHPHYWGLSPSEDQSMAGLTMALEQSIVMGIALVVVFVKMLSESEREAQRQERFEIAVTRAAGLEPGAARRRPGPRATPATVGAARDDLASARRATGSGYFEHLAEPETLVLCVTFVVGRFALMVVEYGRLPPLQPTDEIAATVLPFTFLVRLAQTRCSVSSDPARTPGPRGKSIAAGIGTLVTRKPP